MPSETQPAYDGPRPGSWAELLGREHRTVVTVFASGIVLFAVNTYLTAASLPTAIADIGGQPLYAWVMTVFLLSSVVSSMLVTRAMQQLGPRGAYLTGFGLFGIGSTICALAPNMPIMLVGRLIQGLGGGLLTGLAFTVVRIALPQRLWVRAIGLTSAMWGVGNLLGPVLGGLFAEIGFWRGSFWILVVGTGILIVPAARTLPGRRPDADPPTPVPWASLTVVALATAAVSVAAIAGDPAVMVGLLVAAVLVMGLAIVLERRRAIGLLPAMTYRRGNPLKWIYLSVAVLAIGSTAEAFIPLFGQRLGGMSPFVAGLLGAALSWGWTVAQLASTTWAEGARSRIVRVAGPGTLAVGLAGYGVLQSSSSVAAMTGWFVFLFVAGAGIGMAFPHVATAAMTITDDEDEAARASAGVNSMQMIANTFGSATAGLLVSLGSDDVASAHILTGGFAALAAFGMLIAAQSLRGGRVGAA
ncbi:MFS transporter [Gordonia soli]|uniref:Putative drug resistance transporter n=1 Tax=Gordonia soli NBRC 108243 TaxID=1223545 RepID=M0QIG9_9ACTN|nr:MFS transporter [Gordonia soli]GAC68249.1 putative drug resistance transporter [Gordonia soli NBRC 108243]